MRIEDLSRRLTSYPGVIAEPDDNRVRGKLFIGLRGFRFTASQDGGEVRLILELYRSEDLMDAQRGYLRIASRQLGDALIESSSRWFLVRRGEDVSSVVRYVRALLMKLNEGLKLLEDPIIAEAYLAYNPKQREESHANSKGREA